MLGHESFSIDLEELAWLGWMVPGDVMKGQGGDVVGLALANQRVILEQILLLRLITLGLCMKHSFSFASVTGKTSSATCCYHL